MKSEQASILGKLRRQICPTPGFSYPKTPAPRSYLASPANCASFGHMGPRHAPSGSAPPLPEGCSSPPSAA